MAEPSPMMEQYARAKSRFPDALLFFRLGDFYEMFQEDAVEVSALLNLTLTKRQGEPMCGVPYHAARSYIARLLKAGKKVAIAEQLTEPGKGKGIVERDVVEVVTPGTVLEEDFLDSGANNYLVALCRGQGRLALSWLDVSTAEFRAYAFEASDPVLVAATLRKELFRLSPREVLVQQSLLESAAIAEAFGERPGLIVNRLPDWSFDQERDAKDLMRRFGLGTAKGLGFPDGAPELSAARALLRYVDETAVRVASHLRPPLPYDAERVAHIDESSQKNLEIVQNLHDSSVAFSLLEVLDETRTAAGARLLRQWLLEPLRERVEIEARLDAVEWLYRDQRFLATLREALGRVLDPARLASRVAMDKAHAKDLLALRDSLAACARVRDLLDDAGAPGLLAERSSPEALARLAGLVGLIGRAIKDEPSILLTEGDLIREGYDAGLDRLRGLKAGSHAVLEDYLEEERERSGIANLRVRYNRIIGYYLEVSKGKLESVPAHFIRRQSLVNGERYSTERLAELESEINGATERIVELEKRLFLEVREAAKALVADILEEARVSALHDCLASHAWAATVRGYTRPRVDDGEALRIVEGRHPVVEAHLPAGSFVPNGLALYAGASDTPGAGAPPGDAPGAFALITGPNMAGKSTFLRQTALIVLMAQAGSFVPALEAEIGIVDRIFCRVGAQDNLARGESTFLVEMHETARILNTATEKSLVVMDEVGRGTSTIDGLAIAWAVSEDLLCRLRCRSLFATHYHELTALVHPRLRNLSLAVAEEDGDVVFLKRIQEGPAAGSYGIHVARLAGLPAPVLERASFVQAELSRKEKLLPDAAFTPPQSAPSTQPTPASATPQSGTAGKGGPARAAQADLFDPGELVLSAIASLDIDKMSPLEALNRLADFRKKLQAR